METLACVVSASRASRNISRLSIEAAAAAAIIKLFHDNSSMDDTAERYAESTCVANS